MATNQHTLISIPPKINLSLHCERQKKPVRIGNKPRIINTLMRLKFSWTKGIKGYISDKVVFVQLL